MLDLALEQTYITHAYRASSIAPNARAVADIELFLLTSRSSPSQNPRRTLSYRNRAALASLKVSSELQLQPVNDGTSWIGQFPNPRQH